MKHIIGDQVKTRKMRYLTPDHLSTRETIHPLIEVDGEWAFIADESTLSGLAEFEDRKKAREFACVARDEAVKRNGGEADG